MTIFLFDYFNSKHYLFAKTLFNIPAIPLLFISFPYPKFGGKIMGADDAHITLCSDVRTVFNAYLNGVDRGKLLFEIGESGIDIAPAQFAFDASHRDFVFDDHEIYFSFIDIPEITQRR